MYILLHSSFTKYLPGNNPGAMFLALILVNLSSFNAFVMNSVKLKHMLL